MGICHIRRIRVVREGKMIRGGFGGGARGSWCLSFTWSVLTTTISDVSKNRRKKRHLAGL